MEIPQIRDNDTPKVNWFPSASVILNIFLRIHQTTSSSFSKSVSKTVPTLAKKGKICFVCVYSSLIVYSDEMKREDFYVHPLFECEFERLKNIEFEISGRLFGLYLAAHLISVDPSRSCRMLIPLPPPPCHCQPEIFLYMCKHLAIFGTFLLIYCITLQHSAHRQRHHPRVE